jgi:hypothetical protein
MAGARARVYQLVVVREVCVVILQPSWSDGFRMTGCLSFRARLKLDIGSVAAEEFAVKPEGGEEDGGDGEIAGCAGGGNKITPREENSGAQGKVEEEENDVFGCECAGRGLIGRGIWFLFGGIEEIEHGMEVV